MNNIYNFIKGIFIGIGAILPGISSGVICIIFGLYEKLIDSILNFFKDTKNNFKFIFPIVCGAIISIVLFSNVILYCFDTIPTQIKSLFIGLLLGSIYILYKQEKKEHSSSTSGTIAFFVCFFVGILLIILEKNINSPLQTRIYF